MSKCIPELWTLKEIYQSLSKGYNGDKKIVIPMFQRGKRWSSTQQESFIESLKKSYPIGTLLFYKTTKNDQQIYTLIDGLQRGTAIKKYLSTPTHFFNPSILRSLVNYSFDASFEFVVAYISLHLDMVLSSFKWRGLNRESNVFKQSHLHSTAIKSFLLLGI